jgi:transposase-like protein
MSKSETAESVVREIRRKTRKKYSAEEKIRIVLEGLRGEEGISALCRREGINPNLYYKWSKEFLEAGKRRLITDTKGTFISESSVYRILKSYDLVTSPAYIVLEAADEFSHKTKGIHELWQTDFTYMKVTGTICPPFLMISAAISLPGS